MSYITIKNDEQKNYGLVRKTDLNLRAKYPELQTLIYQTSDGSFIIYIKNRKVDFGTIEEEFEKSVKPIFLPVAISTRKPKGKTKLIPSLEDRDIPKGMQGVLMPMSRWADMLMSKFPHINFYKITDEQGILNIHIANYWIELSGIRKKQFLTRFQEGNLIDFLKRHQSGLEFRIHIDELESPPTQQNGFSKDEATVYYCNHIVRNKPKFIQRDESIWYDNINAIYEGNFRKNGLFFLNENEYACYIDFSVFPNVDLRYCILLYQRIFLSPPIIKNMDEWFKQLSIKRSDFLELILRERITLILVQDISRYDRKFLDEVFALKPDAIVSRRAVACLQQCDIVETADNYLFGDGISIKELKFISEIVAKKSKMDASILFKTLTWPITAKRESFDVLQLGGILSASVYGVNKIIDNPPQGNISESSEFMLNVFSYAAHLSNSLNATYFPVKGQDGFTDATYTETMGTLLNFYKRATINSLKDFVDGEQQLIKGNTLIEPIELIKMNDYIPILELEEVLSKEIVYPNSKRLLEVLAGLNPEEQKQKVELYNTEVQKFLKSQRKTGVIIDLSAQTLNLAIGVASGVPTGPMLFVLKLLGKKTLRSLNPVRRLMEKIELALNQDEKDTKNIHYLSRINRVAKLKEY
tara:strand:+ start:8110 stop:10032 length:1923 start_codon:yes stop_codon:yes gene_type:complete